MIEVYKPGEITSLLEPLANSQTPVILASADVSLLAEIISALRRCPNWYVETSRLLASGAIQTLAGAVGPERILFGTGAPSRPVASALQTINYSGLPSDACQLILSGNAQRIMKIRL
jgi:predicted TIM-barrel fold metal-dependent hydrolase